MADEPLSEVGKELETLLEASITPQALRNCGKLLAMMPAREELSNEDESAKIQALEHVLYRAVNTKGSAVIVAEHLRAASELLGWSKFSEQEQRAILSSSPEIGSARVGDVRRSSVTARLVLAAEHFAGGPKHSKSVRGRRSTIAEYVEDAMRRVLREDERNLKLPNKSERCSDDEQQSDEQSPLTDAGEAADDVSLRGDDEGRSSAASRRVLKMAFQLVVATACALGAAPVVSWLLASPSGDSATNPLAPSLEAVQQSSPAPDVRLALVQHTENRGLRTFLGPANTFPPGDVGLSEGQVIAVVCQVRDGQALFDPDGDPTRYQERWSVWNKLSSGLWVSDLYTDLPKVPGDVPPEGISLC